MAACDKMLVDETVAVENLTSNWISLRRKFSHAGHTTENRAMDVLSYEAIAALHQCYSVAWKFFFEFIGRQEALPEISAYFLAFWHTDRRLPGQKEQADFHLFHGHVFALHGGTGFFLKTPTGRKLIAEYLRNPTSDDALPRLLHGLFVCLHFYNGLLADHAESRKVSPRAFADLMSWIGQTRPSMIESK